MPALRNTRHELFARYLAEGKPASQAYTEAGYKGGPHARANATRLTANETIRARRDEILARKAEKADVTATDVARMLRRAYEVAEAAGNASAMAKSADSLAKLFGLQAATKQTIRHEYAFDAETALQRLEAPSIRDVTPCFPDEMGNASAKVIEHQGLSEPEHVTEDQMPCADDASPSVEAQESETPGTPGGVSTDGGTGPHPPGEDLIPTPAFPDPLGR